MENLIVIEGKEKYKFDDLESLVKRFINDNFYNMSEDERKIELEKKTIANTMLRNTKVVELDKDLSNLDENAFILFDEITYILSLLKFNIIVLLEKTDANIFGKYINREGIEDNYIIINKFANEIMKNYIKNR